MSLVLLNGCGSEAQAPAPAAVTANAGARQHAPSITASAIASARPSVRATTPPTHRTGHAVQGTALAQLATLTVKGRAPMTGYDRDRFGQAWLDADRNGCDTRNDILNRDVTDKTFKQGTRGCVVLTGRLSDPYTATIIAFRRGYGDLVDIDHVVALGDAWATGAGRWDVHVRAALANDPLNLLAVDSHTNRQKGDGDAATWLPPARNYRCSYVARQVAVKAKYRLAVTPAEKAAIVRVLVGCSGQPAIADVTRASTRVDQDIRDPGPTPRASATSPRTRNESGATTPRGLTARSGPVSYRNCDAVRAAGKAPIHRGQPGYSRSLDRDGDGTGCE